MNDNIIEIKNLVKIYRNSSNIAVNDVSLNIGKGEIFGLLGPNGAGKTTTISILCGLFPPTSGTVKINNFSILTETEKMKKIIGVVPQDIALYPTLTALENLFFFGTLYGISGSKLKSRIDECLELMELNEFRKKKVSDLSGGFKRRVNLVAGLLHEPEILFLDEPTSGIDVHSRKIIRDYIRELNKKGTTIFYSSHHLEEAESLCSNLAILDRGRIIINGQLDDLLNSKPEYTNLEKIFLALTGRKAED
jgi:ABC-2 type transport system ATP-binding protein